MKFLFKLIVFILIISGVVIIFYPELLQRKPDDIDSINTQIYTITPNPSKLVLLNLKISSTNIYNTSNIVQGSKLYFDAVNLFDTNIIDLLDSSEDKKSVLKTYIIQLENMQSKLDSTIASLNNVISSEEAEYQTYLSQKQQGDSLFFQGFNQKDSSLVVEGFNQSYNFGPQATKHRIKLSASKVLLARLQKIKSILDSKLMILQNNESIIITNFETIKGDLLRKLLKLKYQLENNKFTE